MTDDPLRAAIQRLPRERLRGHRAKENGVVMESRDFVALDEVLALLASGPIQFSCTTCQKPFDNSYDVYRCANCEMPFHRDCLRNVHFKEQVFPNEREELMRLRANCSTFAAENARLQEELKHLDTTARELLDNAREQVRASGPIHQETGWQPIETLIDPDREVLMWTPVERLYEQPITPTMKPDMRISTKRNWTWATVWAAKPAEPRLTWPLPRASCSFDAQTKAGSE